MLDQIILAFFFSPSVFHLHQRLCESNVCCRVCTLLLYCFMYIPKFLLPRRWNVFIIILFYSFLKSDDSEAIKGVTFGLNAKRRERQYNGSSYADCV